MAIYIIVLNVAKSEYVVLLMFTRHFHLNIILCQC
jgi:hypothetical protein